MKSVIFIGYNDFFMKKLLPFISLLFLTVILCAQPKNSWIQNDQFYYKIGIAENAIHRITVSALSAAGVPVSSFSPGNLQIFFKGKEIPIKVVQNAGVLNYIEFYGERNNGWFDIELYTTPEDQTNPYYSQITDTSAYFLTWNSSTDNKRYTTSSFDQSAAETTEIGETEEIIQYTGSLKIGDEFPEYDDAKGWFDSQTIRLGNTVTKTVNLPGIYTNSGNAIFEIAVISHGSAGSIGNNHHLQIELPDGQIFDTVFYGLKAIRKVFTVPSSALSETNNIFLRSIDDLNVAADNMAASFIKVNYNCDFSMDDVDTKIITVPKSSSHRKVTLTGINADNAPVVIDTANHLTFQVVYNGSNWQFSLPPSSSDHYLVIQKNQTFPGYIETANTQLPEVTETSFLIITNEKLQSSADNYATFRNASVVTTDVLYNYFSYGIEKHPLAIRNYLKYYHNETGTLPEYVFLIGKGIGVDYSRKNSTSFNRNLVPTMGYPPSDNLMVAKTLQTDEYTLPVAVSRLSAETNEQVNQYLSKVQEQQNQQPAIWMKNFVHFGGGVNQSEQTVFAAYLENYRQIIEDSLMGAHVSTFLKNSSDPIQITASDSIRSLINNGTSMLTFFGHGYSGGFDQDIDEPSAYSNQGRYPLMLANSCYSGNIHTEATSSASEKWVLIPDKGAIAFLASVYQGYPSLLDDFSRELYKNLAYKKYGEGLGKIVQQTVSTHVQQSTSLLDKGTALEFAFHGDPAVILNQFDKPDILLQNNQVAVQPANVSTAIDSFAIVFSPVNIGKTISGSVYYQIEHILPNGSDTTYQKVGEGLFYRDTITVWVPIDRQNGTGLNIFNIRTDYLNTVEELDELNNDVEISVNVKSTKIFPVYPYPYSKNDKDTIVLRASTGDPFIEQVHARFELDTTPNFNSPFLTTIENNFPGGVVEWNTAVKAEQGQTYFWRTGSQNEENEIEWQQNSFTTKSAEQGWEQNTIDQLAENNLHLIERNGNTFQFQDAPKELYVVNIGSPAVSEFGDIFYRINGIRTKGACGYSKHVVIAVIDSTDFFAWSSDRNNYGQLNFPKCPTHTFPRNNFLFSTDEASLDDMITFVTEVIPDGHYVVMYSFRNMNTESWKNRHFEAFEALGATIIRGVPNNYPYILVAQKGKPAFAQEVAGQDENETITLSVNLKNNFNYGSITTNWIGPASNWSNVNWEIDADILENEDSVYVDIISKNNPSKDDYVLFSQLPVTSAPFDLTTVDVAVHPYLKMRFFMRDETNRTPAFPQKIECNYTPQSDIAISPGDWFAFPKDSLQEGDNVRLEFALKNVSDIISTEKQIKYAITDPNNKTLVEKTSAITGLNENEFDTDTIEFNTNGLQGYYSIWVNYANNSNDDFFTFNNIGSLPFYVYPDETNPLLDVTFNGRHIMNGDIVSANPVINISLTDENPYLELNDTSLFSIYLKEANETDEKRIFLSPGIEDGSIIWQPAEGDQKAEITYMPQFTKNGIYELRVQARDPSNNLSGENDYRIQFEVINETTITRFFNYPNPFSTSTRFVFVLTGSRIPDHISIDIYTISGKQVRRIDEHELGTINIGRNISEFAWDGTDKFGDQLANGVYLYKVNVTMDGEKVDLRNTEADGFFKKGWGKMYLIR